LSLLTLVIFQARVMSAFSLMLLSLRDRHQKVQQHGLLAYNVTRSPSFFVAATQCDAYVLCCLVLKLPSWRGELLAEYTLTGAT
jgi:hypothetical protein